MSPQKSWFLNIALNASIRCARDSRMARQENLKQLSNIIYLFIFFTIVKEDNHLFFMEKSVQENIAAHLYAAREGYYI